MKKTYKKLKNIMITGIVLFTLGLGLALFMYLSSFMPGNPFRKIFYVVALASMVRGIFLIDKANKLEKVYEARVRRALAATKRRR